MSRTARNAYRAGIISIDLRMGTTEFMKSLTDAQKKALNLGKEASAYFERITINASGAMNRMSDGLTASTNNITANLQSTQNRAVSLANFLKQYSNENAYFKAIQGMSNEQIEIEGVKNKLQQILSEYNLTYEQIDARVHESMLKRGEIDNAEFQNLEQVYLIAQERINAIQEQSSIIRRSFTELASFGLKNFIDGFSVSFVNALRTGQNVLQSFGNFFKALLDTMIQQVMLLITKLLLIQVIKTIFGGAGILGSLFGLKTGGGVTESGKVYHASGGMYVNSGTHSTADDVPVLLSRGEGVLNARVTKMLGGESAIRALNRLYAPTNSFSEGGITPSQSYNVTNINVEGSVIDTAGLLSVLDKEARNSGVKSVYRAGGLV